MRPAALRVSFVLSLFALPLIGLGALSATADQPVVFTVEVDGIIHPVASAYVRRAIREADAAKADLLVITLRTPGGLVDATRDINTAIIQSKTPVAVFVGPSGSRAASAGFLITIAADIAAMAPGTHIGAAHPVSGDGQKIEETMAKKMTSDVADTRGRSRRSGSARLLVEQGVVDSRPSLNRRRSAPVLL
jgi:membrane-bound serine protease (ClpP class)